MQASLLGFAVFKVLPHSPIFSGRPLTVHENVRQLPLDTPPLPSNSPTPRSQIVLQTTAVATGTLPLGAGLVGVIPALSQLTPELDNSPPLILSFNQLLLWCFAVAFFGVFLAVPLRRQFIVKEKLVFPSGTATAQIISVLHGVAPPTESSVDGAAGLRRRTTGGEAGYEALPSSDGEEVYEPEADVKGSEIDAKGWRALSLSFALSAGFTVSLSCLSCICSLRSR